MSRSLFISLTLFVFLFACERFESVPEADTFFHVKIEGTELPVWVKGNTASGKQILFINGGPGLTTLDVARADLLNWSEGLEEEFAMVYYDQRGTGNAPGNIDESTITLEQYVEDLDAIIEVLRAQYNEPKIFLMGHSYGGYIGGNYLKTGQYQDKIAGWISINGSYNFQSESRWAYRREFLINIANEEIAKGVNVAHWQEALDWITPIPVIETDGQKQEWRRFIGNPGEIILPDEILDISARQILQIMFASSYNPFPAYASSNLMDVFRKLIDESFEVNLEDSLHQITLPTLFVQGRYDDLVPPEQTEVVAAYFGTDSTQKEMVVLPQSGHEPYINEPQDFKNAVLDFVRRY